MNAHVIEVRISTVVAASVSDDDHVVTVVAAQTVRSIDHPLHFSLRRSHI